MRLPRVGITAVVTSLNEERYIDRCLTSIFSQTIQPDEVILIDAQSTDKTISIAQSYPITDIYIVPFHDIYRSKRLGVLLAKNDTVLCVDGDSIIRQDFLERGIEHLEEGADVACGYVYPINPNILSNLFASLQHRNPYYLSGPAYVLKRPAYLQVCQITQLDGLADACTQSAEIPLQRFEKVVKDSQMVIYTDLPSTAHRKALLIIGLAAIAGVTGLYLYKIFDKKALPRL